MMQTAATSNRRSASRRMENSVITAVDGYIFFLIMDG